MYNFLCVVFYRVRNIIRGIPGIGLNNTVTYTDGTVSETCYHHLSMNAFIRISNALGTVQWAAACDNAGISIGRFLAVTAGSAAATSIDFDQMIVGSLRG